jgi:tripartite-type tricarboxylate transporter receptor subunit TctC
VVAKLHQALTGALASTGVESRLTKQGLQIYKMPQAEFAKYVADEMTRWKTVIESAGIKAE